MYISRSRVLGLGVYDSTARGMAGPAPATESACLFAVARDRPNPLTPLACHLIVWDWLEMILSWWQDLNYQADHTFATSTAACICYNFHVIFYLTNNSSGNCRLEYSTMQYPILC